ncbi:MAG TPA: hybrid sensor histidine kinase/response regulator [Chloroflexi bacterium]|nr:hybrid sensor histidine kinase/response regulator [Chloroflexota bacterium]
MGSSSIIGKGPGGSVANETGESATVLVVEDEQVILESLADVLRIAGYEVLTATNGAEALAVMETQEPDLILSDIMMPVMDGYDFYRALRANPDWELIPFVFITARGQPNEIREGMGLGVDDYLPKPFEIEDVLNVVETRLRRAQGIRQANRRQLERLKARVMSLLDGELRAPLAQIKNYTDMVASEGAQLDYRSFTLFLEDLNRGAQQLSHLVEDLLRVIEIETGELAALYEQQKERIDWLDHLIGGVVIAFEEEALRREIRLRAVIPPGLPPVEAVPELLSEALNRLLDNAIKFSEAGGQVEVRAGLRDGMLSISVSDQGPGIPVEEQPFIFDVFHQISRDHSEGQGIGLGLAIARGLVELHGGRIEVESEGLAGRGTTLTIRLPVPENPQ